MNSVTRAENAPITPRPLAVRVVEAIIFNAKWPLLLPFYFGLILVLGMFAWSFLVDIVHLMSKFRSLNTEEFSIVALDFGDLTMVGSLIKMIISGGYHSYISKNHSHPLEKITSGMLKVKTSTSVVVVAMVGLLPTFVSYKTQDFQIVMGKLAMFGCFLIGALILAAIEYLHILGETKEGKHENH